jgi:micrococcal nuclease
MGFKNLLHTIMLRSATDPPEFEIAGWRRARLVETHDGDTMKVAIVLRGKVVKVGVRLLGVDTPEVRTKNPAEKAAAVAARDYVAAWALPGRMHVDGSYTEAALKEAYAATRVMLDVEFSGADKFAKRYLGRVHRNGECLNDLLISSGHAVPYDGGKKSAFAGKT